jgi:hypothetical protein
VTVGASTRRAEPVKKIVLLRVHIAAGRWREAMKLAASFPRLGDEKVAIERAWLAYTRPEFCRQLGRDPDQLIEDGKRTLRKKYEEKK